MAGWAIAIIIAIIAIIILVYVGWLAFSFNIQVAHGQNATPPVVQPTPTVAPTPTSPSPNWQFLPQKAYVIPFAPENGIPQNAIPLQSIASPVQQTSEPTTKQSSQIDFNSVMGILGTIGAAGSGLLAKMSHDKAKQSEGIAKDNLGSILQSKEALKELARLLYEKDPQWANQITNAPSVKLETLEKDAAQTREKAANA